MPNRIGSTLAAVGDSVMPGIASGVGSGRATDEMIQTTQSRAMATARPPPTQLRNTGHGSSFQRANVPRVWRAPCTSTYWFTSTAWTSAADDAGLRDRGLAERWRPSTAGRPGARAAARIEQRGAIVLLGLRARRPGRPTRRPRPRCRSRTGTCRGRPHQPRPRPGRHRTRRRRSRSAWRWRRRADSGVGELAGALRAGGPAGLAAASALRPGGEPPRAICRSGRRACRGRRAWRASSCA